MNKLAFFESESQVILNVLNLITFIKSIHIEYGNMMMKAVNNDMPFDPFFRFDFIQNPGLHTPDRKIALLDYDHGKDGSIIIPALDRLLEYFPFADPDTIQFTLITNPHGSISNNNISNLIAIMFYYTLLPGYKARIKDGRYYTYPPAKDGKEFLTIGIPHNPPARDFKHKEIPETPKRSPLKLVPKKKPFKPDRRKKRKTPKDVIKYFAFLFLKSHCLFTLKAMYKLSWYGNIRDDPFYRGPLSHDGSFYTYGIERLMEITGFSRRTINRHIALMIHNDIIWRRQQGFEGRGNAILELAKNLGHVKAWKRKPKTWPKPRK